MKLRIQKNTIRFRLNDKEVATLKEGKGLSEQTSFPTSILYYSIEPSPLTKVDLANNNLRVQLNESAITDWATTDQITLSAEIETIDHEILSIFVEKDMKI